MVVGSTAAGNSACPDTRGRVVQLHRATLPARIVRSACLAAVAAVALGAHRVATASATLGMRDISPYSASPCRSAATVLTQGVRSEKRRVGKESVSTCRYRGSTDHYKNKKI